MKVYLDTCSLQRPLDDKSHLRIRLEAEAILSILDLVKARRLELVASDVLAFELGRNLHRTRRDFALETLAGTTSYIELSSGVEQRGLELNRGGIDTLDSLHLASAEVGEVDYFCTCDDAFLKKAKRAVRGRTRVVSPLELAEEMEKWQFPPDR
jgi:hypothetical protein